MYEMYDLSCPYCGQWVAVGLDPESEGEMVHDCEVCCRPWKLIVQRDRDGNLRVAVEAEG